VPPSGNLVVQTSATHSAVNDLVLVAYTNNCTTFTQIACDEDGNTDVFPSANHARISLTGRTPGEIIYFRVVPRNTDNKGQFSICAFDESVGAVPSISITDVSKKEGNNGTKQFDFTISLSSSSSDTVTVKYKTRDNTAVAPGDYTAISNTVLKFNPGEIAKVISVNVTGDVTVESNEFFNVKLSNPVNATIADNSGKGTIKDDDGPAPEAKSNIENAVSSNKFKISPNPVTGKLNVYMPGTASIYTIQIIDISGRLMKQVQTLPNQKIFTINTESLAKGSYIIKIQSNNESANLKFIKE
jgi:hypothetical protein